MRYPQIDAFLSKGLPDTAGVSAGQLRAHKTFFSCNPMLTLGVKLPGPFFSRELCRKAPFFRSMLVTPTPHIQGKIMNKHLDKI